MFLSCAHERRTHLCITFLSLYPGIRRFLSCFWKLFCTLHFCVHSHFMGLISNTHEHGSIPLINKTRIKWYKWKVNTKVQKKDTACHLIRDTHCQHFSHILRISRIVEWCQDSYACCKRESVVPMCECVCVYVSDIATFEFSTSSWLRPFLLMEQKQHSRIYFSSTVVDHNSQLCIWVVLRKM